MSEYVVCLSLRCQEIDSNFTMTTAVLMTDCAEQFTNSWCEASDNNSGTRFLFCEWHCQRAWKKRLLELPKEMRQTVRAALKVCLTHSISFMFGLPIVMKLCMYLVKGLAGTKNNG